MALQDIVRLVLPKETHFFDFLEQQAALAHEGAEALLKLESSPVAEVKQAVQAIEKKGDKIQHELEDALALTFVTPLDREDIHRLSVLLDDILDRAHATASAFEMFSIDKPSDEAVSQMRVLVKTTELLREIVPSLRRHEWEAIREGKRKLKVFEKEGDEVYRSAMKRLFAETGLEARLLIREKEVIEILEDAIDTCEDASEFLTNLAVKHG